MMNLDTIYFDSPVKKVLENQKSSLDVRGVSLQQDGIISPSEQIRILMNSKRFSEIDDNKTVINLLNTITENKKSIDELKIQKSRYQRLRSEYYKDFVQNKLEVPTNFQVGKQPNNEKMRSRQNRINQQLQLNVMRFDKNLLDSMKNGLPFQFGQISDS